MDDMRGALLAQYDAACTTTCHYCPCPLPPETVRCRLCGRLQERGGDSTAHPRGQAGGQSQDRNQDQNRMSPGQEQDPTPEDAAD